VARKNAPVKSPLPSLDAFGKSLGAALDKAESDPESVDRVHEHEGNPRNLAPRVPEAADIAAKHQERTAAAGAAWKAGVMRPKKDPIEAAKAAAGKWETKVKEAIANKSFTKGLDAVDEAEMIRILEETDASVFTEGVRRRGAKYERKVGAMRPMLVALTNELDRMPVDTEQQREAKAIASIRGMREIGRRLKGLK